MASTSSASRAKGTFAAKMRATGLGNRAYAVTVGPIWHSLRMRLEPLDSAW
jgi:hypothetical protein